MCIGSAGKEQIPTASMQRRHPAAYVRSVDGALEPSKTSGKELAKSLRYGEGRSTIIDQLSEVNSPEMRENYNYVEIRKLKVAFLTTRVQTLHE